MTILFSPINIILWVLMGLVAGYLASRVVKSGNLGIVGNIVVGLLGSLIGGFLANLLGINAFGWLGSLVIAFLGACLLLWLIGAVSGRK